MQARLTHIKKSICGESIRNQASLLIIYEDFIKFIKTISEYITVSWKNKYKIEQRCWLNLNKPEWWNIIFDYLGLFFAYRNRWKE